jgi:hypothetical protein
MNYQGNAAAFARGIPHHSLTVAARKNKPIDNRVNRSQRALLSRDRKGAVR